MFDIPGIPGILVLTGGDNLWLGEAVFDLHGITSNTVTGHVFPLDKWYQVKENFTLWHHRKHFFWNKTYLAYVKQVCYNSMVKCACKPSELEVFLLPLDRMLVHHRVTPSIKFTGTHLYTWDERGSLHCLFQDHQTMSPAKAWTWSASSRGEHTNHEATTTPQATVIDSNILA